MFLAGCNGKFWIIVSIFFFASTIPCKIQKNNKVKEFEAKSIYYFSTTSTATGVPTDAAQGDSGLTCSEDYLVVRVI